MSLTRHRTELKKLGYEMNEPTIDGCDDTYVKFHTTADGPHGRIGTQAKATHSLVLAEGFDLPAWLRDDAAEAMVRTIREREAA